MKKTKAQSRKETSIWVVALLLKRLQTEHYCTAQAGGDCYTVLLWFRQAHRREAKQLSLQRFVLPFQDQFRRVL